MYNSIIVIILLLAASALQSRTIEGKLTGYDNMPMYSAHVNFSDIKGEHHILVNKDGTFKIDVNEDYFVEIEFTGVNHQSYTKKIFFPDGRKPLDIAIKLEPNIIPKKFNKILINGNFNDFSMDNGLIEMAENSDSVYSASVKKISDTLLYQVMFDAGKNNKRSINGQQSDFYVYDGEGDYRSGIISNTDVVNIKLDLKKFPKGKYSSSVTSNDKLVQFSLGLEKQLNDYYYDYIVKRSEVVMNYKKYDNPDSEVAKYKKMYFDSVEKVIQPIKDKNLRFMTLLTYMDIASDGINVEDIKDVIRKDLVKELKSYLPVDSKFLDKPKYNDNPLFISRILEKDYYKSDYLNKIIETHNTDGTAWLVLYAIRYSDRLKDTINVNKYYKLIMNKFPDSKQARYAKNELGKDIHIAVGKQIPDFKFANLDNPSDTIKPASLKGKYVLFDIWGTWCGPCLMEMKYLDSAYKTFKDKNFIIYSHAVDKGPKVVQNFRKNKWPMPWLHSLAEGGWDSEQVKLFEVVGVPKTFLVDPDGKIVETEKLRQDNLLETLGKYLK